MTVNKINIDPVFVVDHMLSSREDKCAGEAGNLYEMAVSSGIEVSRLMRHEKKHKGPLHLPLLMQTWYSLLLLMFCCDDDLKMVGPSGVLDKIRTSLSLDGLAKWPGKDCSSG